MAEKEELSSVKFSINKASDIYLRGAMNAFLTGSIGLEGFIGSIQDGLSRDNAFTSNKGGLYKNGSFIADYLNLMNDSNTDHLRGLDTIMEHIDASRGLDGKELSDDNISVVQALADQGKWKSFYSVLSKNPDSFHSLKRENMIDAYAVAAGENDLVQMRRFLESDFDPSVKNKKGETALSLYLQKTKGFKTTTVNELIASVEEVLGSDSNEFKDFINNRGTENSSSITPLGHMLARYNKTQNRRARTPEQRQAKDADLYQLKISFNDLLLKGADPNFQTKTGMSPLMFAVSKELPKEIINDLLTVGADVNMVASSGKTALSYAAESGNLEMVQLLLEKNANPNGFHHAGNNYMNDRRPIVAAALKGQWKIVNELAKNGADIGVINGSGKSTLMEAIEEANSTQNVGITQHEKQDLSELADTLLAKGVNPDTIGVQKNEKPIIAAALRGNWTQVNEMLHQGANINTLSNTGESLLFIALESSALSERPMNNLMNAKSEKYKMIESLLDRGINPATVDNTQRSFLIALGEHCIQGKAITKYNVLDETIQLIGNKCNVEDMNFDWKPTGLSESFVDMLEKSEGAEQILGNINLMIDGAQKARVKELVGEENFDEYMEDNKITDSFKVTKDAILTHKRQKQREQLKKRENDAKTGLEILTKGIFDTTVKNLPILAVSGTFVSMSDSFQKLVDQVGGSYAAAGILGVALIGQAYMNIPSDKREKVWTALDFYSKKVTGFLRDRVVSPTSGSVLNGMKNFFNGAFGVLSNADKELEKNKGQTVQTINLKEVIGAEIFKASNDPIIDVKVEPNLKTNVVNTNLVHALFSPNSDYTRMIGGLDMDNVMKYSDVIRLIRDCQKDGSENVKTSVTDQRISEFIGALSKSARDSLEKPIVREGHEKTTTINRALSENIVAGSERNESSLVDRLTQKNDKSQSLG